MIEKEQLKAKLDAPKINQLQGKMFSNAYPSNTQMAKNLGNSIIRNVQSVASGNSFKVTEGEANARLEICKTCEFFNATQQRCSKCGCYMAVKTYLKAESCPVGKW